MTPLVLSGGLAVPRGSPLAAGLRASASMPNPAAAKHAVLVEKGRISRWAKSPPAMVEAWRDLPAEHAWAGGTVAPRHTPGAPTATHDRRSDGEPAEFATAPGFELRPYQRQALRGWFLAQQEGVIVAPCGSGKTCIGLAAASFARRRTLVLVHTLDLAEQWKKRALSQIGTEAGIVGDGTCEEEAPLVVATMQTLDRWEWSRLYSFGSRFGLVVVDEAHKVGCQTLSGLLLALPSRRRLGLTATPEREDGLTPLLHWSLGPVVARIEHADLAAAGAILIPELRTIRTGWAPAKEEQPWSKVVGELCADPARNALLLSHVLALVREGLQVLVLSERVEHCEAVAASCAAAGIPSAALVGKRTAKQRAAILRAADEGAFRVVTGTTLADEGLDLPGLGAVVLATPSKAMGRIEQRIGRVMRPSPGKPRPVVVDLLDAWGPLLHQARLRRGVYARLGVRM